MSCDWGQRFEGDQAWLEKFFRGKHIATAARAARELRILAEVPEEAGCYDLLNLAGFAGQEAVAWPVNVIVDAYKHGGALSHADAKYLTPFGDADGILVPALRGHATRRANDDQDIAQSLWMPPRRRGGSQAQEAMAHAAHGHRSCHRGGHGRSRGRGRGDERPGAPPPGAVMSGAARAEECAPCGQHDYLALRRRRLIFDGDPLPVPMVDSPGVSGRGR